jgi:hypothetical protein
MLERSSAQHVWIGGYWVWQNSCYEWMVGHWVLLSHSGVKWVVLRWVLEGNSYRFYDGYWV